eukprot:1147173-Pelagomonas_calceolata.AAC.1
MHVKFEFVELFNCTFGRGEGGRKGGQQSPARFVARNSTELDACAVSSIETDSSLPRFLAITMKHPLFTPGALEAVLEEVYEGRNKQQSGRDARQARVEHEEQEELRQGG